jgi:hypothetical protein
MRKSIALAGALLVCGFCTAAEVQSLQGVWKGSLGGNAIVACFNGFDHGASYYYVKSLSPIALSRHGESEGRWHEDKNGGLWALGNVSDDGRQVTGTWTGGKSGQPLPIALQRIDGENDTAACGRDSYASALERVPTITAGERVTSHEHAYRTLSFVGQRTLEILDEGQAVHEINRQLLSYLDQSPAAVAEQRMRHRDLLAGHAYGGDDEQLVLPVYWSPQWLTITFSRWAPGTGKSGISYGNRTWNLSSGKQVDLWSWFGGQSTSRDNRFNDGRGPMPPALRDLVFERVDTSPDAIEPQCEGNYQPGAEYLLMMDDEGMTFEQPATGDGCELSFSMTYEQLLPVMTQDGKAAVRQMKER